MNEIPVALFEALGLLLVLMMFYTLLRKTLITSLLSTVIAMVMAQSILNGNVVMVYTDGTGIQYSPIQSLPIHYLLLGISVIMTILTFYILIMYLVARIESIDQEAEGYEAGHSTGYGERRQWTD